MPKLITQDALMNEHDASNSNATLVNNCKSRNVPFSHMHYTMHIISIKILFFENLIFHNFVSFYLILFNFIFQKKFSNVLFIVDRSNDTVHGLLFMDYCSRNILP